MVHVSAQEAHFLMGLLDLGIQPLYLLLQVCRSQEEQEAGSSLKNRFQENQKTKLSLANRLGSELKQAHRLGVSKAPKEPLLPQMRQHWVSKRN